jgi:hypothetical protein
MAEHAEISVFGGVAALVIGGAMLLANASAFFAPVLGIWLASPPWRWQSRTAEAENRRAGHAARAGGVARRGQQRRVNSWPIQWRAVSHSGTDGL